MIKNDVVFDLAIRTVQIPLLASPLRAVLRTTASSAPTGAYWPNPDTWGNSLPWSLRRHASLARLTYPDPMTRSPSSETPRGRGGMCPVEGWRAERGCEWGLCGAQF